METKPQGPETYDDRPVGGVVRGRAAQLNPPNRFEPVRLSVFGEALDDAARDHPDGHQMATRVFRDDTRTIINRVDSPDMPFHWTINPYRGCEHGCIYCYARPTHETFGLSCGLDFDTQIFAKLDAAKLLRRELGHRSWQGEHIVMSGVTDAYQPVERRLRITRSCLEVMVEARQPVSIVTKNNLITRDIDLLRELARHQAVFVALSITSLDPRLAARMEPRASAPASRLEAVRELSQAGVPVMVMTAPIIPGLNDVEIPALLEAAKEAGALSAAYTMLRLPYQVKALFLDWIAREFPDRAGKIEALIRDAREGELNDSTWGQRLRGTGARAEQVGALFRLHAKRVGFTAPVPALSSAAFRRPTIFDDPAQISLFGDESAGRPGV